MTDPTGSKSVLAKAPSFRLLDEEDAARFVVAAEKYDAANTVSKEVATAKLRELGFIDELGKPTKPYR